MSVAVVVGGQYGSEGKGKMTSYLALADDAAAVIRCGGPNAGHTVLWKTGRFALRQVPAGFVNPRTRLLLAAGSIVHPDILCQEIKELAVQDRIGIDRNAAILEYSDTVNEANSDLGGRLGSTLSGTGSVTSRKVLRDPQLKLAYSEPRLSRWVTDVSLEANLAIDNGELVVVEGTQGFGLSLHHGGSYPFATSRDTTAASFLSEAGLSPMVVKDVIIVIRTFPIRVAGNSGPLNDEIMWSELQDRSGYPHPVTETTTVTGRVRRIATFRFDIVEQAVRVNRPTHLAVHGLDYLSYEDFGKTSFHTLSKTSRTFIDDLEDRLNVPATYLFTGPPNTAIIDRRREQLAINPIEYSARRRMA